MSRRRGASVGIVVLALVIAASACGSVGDPAASEGGAATTESKPVSLEPITDAPEPTLPVTVPSAGDAPVTIESAARILPLSGSLSETVFALGLGERVVGRDISATFDEAKDLPLVTRAHDVSAEAVLSLEPTVVLAQTDTGPPEALDLVRAAGVPVVVFDLPTDIDDVAGRMRAVAAALGVVPAGEELVERTQAAISDARAAIPSDVPAPTVAFLYIRGSAGVYLLAGEGSGADSMIEAAGGIDAGTAMGLDRPFTPLTSEALVEAAPDVILMTTTGLESVGGIDGLLEIPGIAQTPAGQQRRIVTEEDGLLYSFGSRTPAALAALIAQLFPTGP